jgi:hypothetical protein
MAATYRPPTRDLQFYALAMKVLKNVFLVVGLLAVAGAVAILVKNAWDLRILYEVAMANKSQPSVVNPTNLVLIGAGVGLLGGVLLGLGIGLPRRTANAIRHETIEELHRQTTADAALAAAAVPEPAEEPHTEPTA